MDKSAAQRRKWTFMRIRRLRRGCWFWFKADIGFGKRGFYVSRY